jgi:MoaA/NifB/PqqE/SkfB family radical SAM enzyme
MTSRSEAARVVTVFGLRRRVVRTLIWLHVLWRALKAGRLLTALAALPTLLAQARALGRPSRGVKVAGRHFSGLFSPGWPSLAFQRYADRRIRQAGAAPDAPGLPPLVYLAITRACPLRCQHCFERHSRGRPDTVSEEQLVALLRSLQQRGVSQVVLSGGEPLSRFPVLLRLLLGASAGTDFWVFTSGFGLTAERARLLARAGLTGVVISLDHWAPARHDAFRGRRGSYHWARLAARHARDAGLVVALSLCARSEIISREDLGCYARVARRMGAAVIQLLEPRARGAYAGRQVALSAGEQRDLEAFATEMNSRRAPRDMPVVEYPSWIVRRLGCQGAALDYLYVDTDGRLHPCPFSTTRTTSVMDGDLDRALAELRRQGCGLCADVGSPSRRPARCPTSARATG